MNQGSVALKEWAVIVRALLEGKQHVILRKGGIREETRDFQLESDSFYFYPTYEHQKKELIKDVYRDHLEETIVGWSPDQATVRISGYAEVFREVLITEQHTLDKLDPFHMFTGAFAETRLKWKPKKPLHVVLLRVYRLDTPAEVSVKEEYSGCRSWIRLEEELSSCSKHPVLSDEQFAKQTAKLAALSL